MGKHAYLIIANRNINQLNILVKSIDDSRNDIFLLVDKKSGMDISSLSTLKSGLFILNEINIYWGSYSQIQAEINLFRAASENMKYDFYHLISGLDLPLASQNEIHEFFDEHLDNNFLTFSSKSSKKDLDNRFRYHFFRKHYRSDSAFLNIFRKAQNVFYKVFKKSNKSDLNIVFGSNWVSLNDKFVRYLLSKTKWIEKTFKYGYLVDELFIHMLITNDEKFKSTIYDNYAVNDRADEFQGNLRYINWWDGKPYTWKINDYDVLENAHKRGHLFSRKFDEHVDSEIISKVLKNLK